MSIPTNHLPPCGDFDPDANETLNFHRVLQPFIDNLNQHGHLRDPTMFAGCHNVPAGDQKTALVFHPPHATPAPWDAAAAAAHTAGQQVILRSENAVALVNATYWDAHSNRQQSLNTATKSALMAVLSEGQRNIAKGPAASYMAAEWHDINNFLENHYNKVSPGALEAILAAQMQPWNCLKTFNDQLHQFEQTNTCLAKLTGAALPSSQVTGQLIAKSTSGPLTAFFAFVVQDFNLRRPNEGPGIDAAFARSPTILAAALRSAFESLSPQQLLDYSAAFTHANLAQSNAATIQYSGPLHKVVQVAQSLPNDAASVYIATKSASSRSASPSAGAQSGHTPIRQGQTTKAKRPAAKPSSTAKWCSLHNIEGHTTADCTEIAKLSPGLQRLYLSRAKPIK
jgi:hypothetical protein